jgi:hypothetical protein
VRFGRSLERQIIPGISGKILFRLSKLSEV